MLKQLHREWEPPCLSGADGSYSVFFVLRLLKGSVNNTQLPRAGAKFTYSD